MLMLPVMLTVILTVTAGCEQTTAPDDLIDEETYIKILAEMHLLAAVRETYDDEQRYTKLQEAVLEHYNITREQFERSHDYYFRDMDEQQRRFREARQILDEINQEAIYQQYSDPPSSDTAAPANAEPAPPEDR